MATERFQVYQCGICGTVLEVLTGGEGVLACCGEPMQRLRAQLDGAGWSWRPPAFQQTSEGLRVQAGFPPHPLRKGPGTE
jgi:superoxide reductase